ncbi:drs2 neo1 protein, partial [Coemansia guatemalensis]
QDAAMYHAPTNTRAAARTTAINEDLGMVRYVFSDKTGTLTENIMKLRAVMCAGFSYLHIDLDRLQAPAEVTEGTDAGEDAESSAEAEVSATKSTPSPDAPHNRTSSRLSFLRSSLGGRQSPLLRTQLLPSHRRQQSMPVSPASSPPLNSSGRTRAQQVAAASSSRHSRGVSTSGLRWPASPVQSPTSALQHEVHAGPEDSSPSTNNARRLEEASEGNDSDGDDPDVIGDGEPGDPGMHTRADADAPTSDLLQLPSTRRMLGGVAAAPSQVFRARAEWFLRSMALCHTVQPDRDPLTGRITGYQATSPDEKALVAAAAELGFVMNNRAGPLVQLRVVASERMRDFNRAVVAQPASAAPRDPTVCAADAQSFDRGVPAPHPSDRLGNYEVLDVLDFSSARKRMSVVLRCPDGRIVMLCKGADSALWPRLRSPAQLPSDAADLAFMPRPPAPAAVPVRRKLSQPSAAYLHSRNASVTSAAYLHSRNESVSSSQGLLSGQGHARTASHGLADSSLPPTRAVPRLSDGRMFFGELAGGRRSSALSSAAASPRPAADSPSGFFGESESDDDSTDAPELPASVPPPALSGALHRRLVSDSHFSAMSEASSFADTQGQEHIPESFATPTAEEEEWARARALEALHQFSTEGLRTLVYAHKEISQAAYDAWHVRYLAATTALAGRQQQVEAVCEDLERDLLLTGVSAIEDRLQAGVPETIFKLRRAGVRVWMLTGDKVETAINIAKSCRLIDTEAVEISELDQQVLKRNAGRMMLLVMQSGTAPDDLDRIVTNALNVARDMAATVDQRFERRSRLDKMRRGMKRFGNLLDIRRVRRQQKQVGDNDAPSSSSPDEEEKKQAYSEAAAAVAGERSENWIRPPAESEEKSAADIERAQDLRDSAPTTILGVSPHDPITEISPVTTAVSRGNNEGRSDTLTRQKQRLLPIDSSTSESSSHSSDATRSPPHCHAAGESSSDNACADDASSDSASLAVVVDGDTLAALEEHASTGLLDKFLSLGTLCDAVICSRVSPAQKALVVHSMRVRCEGGGNKSDSADAQGRKKPSSRRRWNPFSDLLTHDNDRYMVTLAIGDGANDIAMIQEAHVGVGIAGQEGLQASRSADFSIAQFRFLQRLMLVHGRWSYVRVSMFIMGTFYKCMAFYLTQLIFQFYTGFSGTSLFESWTLSMYNTLFSILPVLVVGIFEQDLQPETLLAFPELYRDMGPSNHLFTVPEFIKRVVVIGFVHAIVAAYFPIATNLLLGYNGTTDDQYILGLVIYCIMVLIVTLKIAYLDMRRWLMFSHISVILSLALWFGWNGVLNHIYPKSPGEGYFVLGVFDMVMRKGSFWFQWIIFAAIALCLNLLILMVYSIRDPIEHRLSAWIARERRLENTKDKSTTRSWRHRRGLTSFF